MMMDEIVAISLMCFLCVGMALAFLYIMQLTAFLSELKRREPDIWHHIGSPTFLNMLFLPFHRFKKFYAFLPVLKERADGAYPHARKAFRLLKAGLALCLIILAHIIALAWLVI